MWRTIVEFFRGPRPTLVPLLPPTGDDAVDRLERARWLVANFHALGVLARPWGGTRGVWFTLRDAEVLLDKLADTVDAGGSS